MMTRIYIAKERLHEGTPAIAVDRGGSEVEFSTVLQIDGPSQVRQDPRGMPARDGRRPAIQAWIETESECRREAPSL